MKAALPFVLLSTLPSTLLAESSLPNPLRVISRKLREQAPLFHLSQERHHQSWSIRSRFLQEDVCTAPSDVFDDDVYLLIFPPSAEPECFCEDIEGLMDVNDFLAENPIPDSAAELQDWIDAFNVFVMNLEVGERYGCRNECSICAGESCAFVETSESTRSRVGYEQNLTLADFLTLADATDGTVDSFLQDGLLAFETEFTTTVCYTPAVENPTVMCLTAFGDFFSDEGTPIDQVDEGSVGSSFGCMVTVGGIECASCEIDPVTFCILLDCTNIGGNPASLDFCSENRADYPGVYSVLYDFEVNDVEYTLGSCDDDAPIVVPSPMEPNVTDAPVPSPVMEPTTTDAPVPSPIILSPVMESATPVKQPVQSPVPPSPPITPPVSSPIWDAPSIPTIQIVNPALPTTPLSTKAPAPIVPSPIMSSPVMGTAAPVKQPVQSPVPPSPPMTPPASSPIWDAPSIPTIQIVNPALPTTPLPTKTSVTTPRPTWAPFPTVPIPFLVPTSGVVVPPTIVPQAGPTPVAVPIPPVIPVPTLSPIFNIPTIPIAWGPAATSSTQDALASSSSMRGKFELLYLWMVGGLAALYVVG